MFCMGGKAACKYLAHRCSNNKLNDCVPTNYKLNCALGIPLKAVACNLYCPVALTQMRCLYDRVEGTFSQPKLY